MSVIRLTERQWQRYHRGLAGAVTQRLAERREVLIVEHLVMCERIARKVARILPYHLDIEDLVQCGRIGLVQAADRYRSDDGPFTRFAYFRIRGAIIDAHKRRAYQEELHESLDYVGDDREVVARSRQLRDRAPLPDVQAAESEKMARLAAAIGQLPDQEREVLQRALAGELAGAIAASHGHSPNWARVRLNAARDKVAARMREAA
jgi:RNA polymerase sigma factor (sigma-70 family)